MDSEFSIILDLIKHGLSQDKKNVLDVSDRLKDLYKHQHNYEKYAILEHFVDKMKVELNLKTQDNSLSKNKSNRLNLKA